MIKQIYIDDITGEEITGDVYQIELSTVNKVDIELPMDLDRLIRDMHFSLESIVRLLKQFNLQPEEKAKWKQEKEAAVSEEIILIPEKHDEECKYDDDSIKGIDEGRLKALYYAGWSNSKIGNEIKKSKKAVSTKISLMIKSGKLTRRQND